MGRVYDKGDGEIRGRVKELISEHFPDLLEANAKIDILFAVNDDGHAVVHRGSPAAAKIRIINLADRTAGFGDAQIIMDKKHYDELSDRKRDGLLHHELHHLILAREKEGGIKVDDLGRPKFKMRPHDLEVGWFAAVAELYKEDSPEISQARSVLISYKEQFFPFIEDLKVKKIPASKA